MNQPYDPFAKLDLSEFDKPEAKTVDRDAAEASRAAGEEAGFTSRRAPARPRGGRGGAAKAAPKSETVRLSDVFDKPIITGQKSQLNLVAPVDLILRFKTAQKIHGFDTQWQTLAAALDALDAQQREAK